MALALGACRDALVQPDVAEAGADGNGADVGSEPIDDLADSPTPNDMGTDTVDVASVDAPGMDVLADRPTDRIIPTDVPVVDGGSLSPAAIPERRVTCGPRAGTPSVTAGAPDRFVLRGRVVTPTGVIAAGEVLIAAGRLACVAASCSARAEYAGATIVTTAGVIYPGLIDAHNHTAYNWLPEWTPPMAYGNHGQWQRTASYNAFVQPYSDNTSLHECTMGKWGELRSLVAGTTSIQGSPNRLCLASLVRSPEFGRDFGGVDRHSTNVLGISTVPNPATAVLNSFSDGGVTTYILHLAEGTDTTALSEWSQLTARMMLVPQVVIIHGTALGAAEHTAFGAIGGRLVWSPRSNIILYRGTTNIPLALDSGTLVALAPDWTPSGGPNLLSELRYAREVSTRLFAGRLTARDLFEMVTSRAARVLDRHTLIGSLTEGLYADVLVVPDFGCDAYDTLIDTATADVEMVFVGGRPLYGDRPLMNALPASLLANCEDATYCGVDKRICVSRGPGAPDLTGQTMADLVADFGTFTEDLGPGDGARMTRPRPVIPYPLVPLCPP